VNDIVFVDMTARIFPAREPIGSFV
jgi:hypothetical protein